MYRLRVIGTGVVGSPYYMNWYFGGIDAENASTALTVYYESMRVFTTEFLTYELDPTVPTINAASGQIIGSTTLDTWSRQGSATADILPTQVQALTRFSTGVYVNGRQVQGRMNYGGLTEAAQNNGAFLIPTVVTDMQEATSDLFAALVAGGTEPIVWSRTSGTEVPISAMTVQPALATLRSRSGRSA